MAAFFEFALKRRLLRFKANLRLGPRYRADQLSVNTFGRLQPLVFEGATWF